MHMKDPDRVKRELEAKAKADKANTIQGSYLNNASDLLLSFSANELSNRDITVQRRASGVASTHLQHLDAMNTSVKEALTHTVNKSETAGVDIEERDNVAIGSMIENPRVSNVLRQASGLTGSQEILRVASGLSQPPPEE